MNTLAFQEINRKNHKYLLNNVVLFISVFDKIPQKFKASTLYKNTFSTNVFCSLSGLNKTQCSEEDPVAASWTVNPNILERNAPPIQHKHIN